MSLNTTFMDCNHYCMSKIQQSKPKKKKKLLDLSQREIPKQPSFSKNQSYKDHRSSYEAH